MGKIYQINIKPQNHGGRGLPKFPIDEAFITYEGVEGDYNRYRQQKLNGDPDQAILLMPLEMIAKLNEENWPASPGDLGENITTEGIPYESFAALTGKIYRIGNEVEIQISKACKPCKNLYLLPYIGEERGPEFLKMLLGRRGWYARVLKEGLIKKGDEINELY